MLRCLTKCFAVCATGTGGNPVGTADWGTRTHNSVRCGYGVFIRRCDPALQSVMHVFVRGSKRQCSVGEVGCNRCIRCIVQSLKVAASQVVSFVLEQMEWKESSKKIQSHRNFEFRTSILLRSLSFCRGACPKAKTISEIRFGASCFFSSFFFFFSLIFLPPLLLLLLIILVGASAAICVY
jgi:ferredoxin